MSRSPLIVATTILLLASGASGACEPRVAGLAIEDATLFRGEDDRCLVDVDVRAVHASGREIGRHCVAVFWFPPGTDLGAVPEDAAYAGTYESAVRCFPSGMEDGDTRRVRLESKSKDIPAFARVRVQGVVGSDISSEDFTTP